MDITLSKAANAYKQAGSIGGGIANGDMVSDAEQTTGPSFSELVNDGLSEARTTGYQSEAVSSKALANKAALTDLVSSITNAELTLNTVVAIRDKIIGAYQDILRMPI